MNPYPKTKQTNNTKTVHGKADKGKEDVLQSQCEEYLKYMNIEYWRIPDNCWRWVMGFAPVHIKTLFSRYFKGKPDMTVLLPSGQYLNIELKSKSGKLTQGQENFAKRSELHIVKSFDVFKELVDSGIKI